MKDVEESNKRRKEAQQEPDNEVVTSLTTCRGRSGDTNRNQFESIGKEINGDSSP